MLLLHKMVLHCNCEPLWRKAAANCWICDAPFAPNGISTACLWFSVYSLIRHCFSIIIIIWTSSSKVSISSDGSWCYFWLVYELLDCTENCPYIWIVCKRWKKNQSISYRTQNNNINKMLNIGATFHSLFTPLLSRTLFKNAPHYTTQNNKLAWETHTHIHKHSAQFQIKKKESVLVSLHTLLNLIKSLTTGNSCST